MFKKTLKKIVELPVDENIAGYDGPIGLEYYLIESHVDDFEELSNQTVYGIEIVKKVKGKDNETGMIKNLSCCKDSAKRILDKLIKNTVTPVELPYIMDDIIGT